MAAPELNAFIWKFHQLWQAGLTAHLDVDTHAGNAWVGLRVQLGHYVPGPIHRHVNPPPSFSQSSSRQRRRARRMAAREQENNTAAEEAVTTPVKEAATEEVVKASAEVGEKSEEANAVTHIAENCAEKEISDEDIENVAEKANDFPCVLCDFKSTWANGLEVHMGRKHRNIDQLDGSNDSEDLELDKKYDRSEHYWEKGNVGIAYSVFLDSNCLVDASNLSEEEKLKEKGKLLASRKSAFGNNFHQFPPWSKR